MAVIINIGSTLFWAIIISVFCISMAIGEKKDKKDK